MVALYQVRRLIATAPSYRFFFRFPAFESAMAIACFCGLPSCIKVEMFFEIVFLLLPFFSGIVCS